MNVPRGVYTAAVVLLAASSAASDPTKPLDVGAACSLTNVTSSASWTFQAGFVSGEGIFTFFNPEADCGTSPYPYEITTFQFMLGGSTSQVSVDIVAYDAVSADSCDGPGVELFRATIQVQGNNSSPQQYTFLPGGLCVNGPFFMGLEFHHSSLPGPARQAVSPPLANRCENYILTGGSFVDAVNFGFGYYPAFWITGQTGQCRVSGACCDPFGSCSISTQVECEALGRTYLGDNTDCDPNPCTPTFDCVMTNTTGGNSWVFLGGLVAGEGLYTYYNPQVDCGSSAYPFQLGGFRFMFGGSTVTQNVDIVVYDVVPSGDSCDGPGAELFRFTTSATGNNSVPSQFEFPIGQCCVDGPFFIGLEVHHSGAPGPGRELNGSTPAACENWIRTQPDGAYYDAAVFGVTKYPGYWVYGEPGSACRPPGACCDPYNSCTVTTQAECEAQGGTYGGDGTSCDPNPCSPGGDCTLTNVTATDSWTFMAGFVSGEGLYTFFNPEDDCGTPAYPYELAAFQFMLGGSTGQVSVDIVAYDVAVSADSCDGPGVELFRTTIPVEGADDRPQQYDFLPGALCVDGPFFMGLELNHSSLPGPARQAGSAPQAKRCENYIWSGGSYIDASDFGLLYYPAFWIYGQTEHCQVTCCVGRIGDVNNDGADVPTIGDISVLIDAKFISGTCAGKIVCIAEADANQSGAANPDCDDLTIGDISILIDCLFITGPDTYVRKTCL
jgi:hypothetical protein